ncbi:Putative Cyanovirin-N [[Torrubiella] hemipterigena]|uniref:Putative Cyanovirin-N n=1 Tax=[Torrubiella] hemipterigena TaxID=1531966 RepID=A0A0A1TT81_9HYPO|nr:Putative Cyanovirin-N [[Torrubiella] hemipterigena]
MSFHASAENIRVDDGHILRANLNGQDAELDLNSCLGNNNGRFEWGGRDFASSAENITFSIEGGANVPVLRARLGGPDGPRDADVNLGERISNDNGQLRFN